MTDTTETTDTTTKELPKAYRPADFEGAIYERWLAADVFAPDGAGSQADPDAEPFTIIQPPPNITGSLHLGHAQRTAVEDLMIRHARMLGRPTLFLPGLDHASIAAQFVLDRIIAAEGETRQSLGRERYLERMWRFINETREVMLGQQRRVGGSFDWSRLKFTMDDFSSRAVREAFFRLHRDGLAYRTEALVNWCPGCRTSVSDLEVIPTPETGSLWTIRYHLLDEATGQPDPDATIAVATTRPETILGDTAVAVHPDDPRYRDLVGRKVRIPFVERDVPVIADEAVEREFGTGALKITPAHDNDDYAIGRRHDLPMITVLDDAAAIAGTGTPYDGLDRYEARQRILADLETRGDLLGTKPHEMLIGRCQRSNDVIEPRLKTQWFIKTRPLAERALAATRSGRTQILPERFVKVWEHWMTNIRDWNVSRQLWWGHQIPAWYCPDGHVTVSAAEGGPSACDVCGRPASDLTQDPDIFDTWFSSGLVAVFDARLARRHARLSALLPDVGHGDRPRDPLLLGRPDDDAWVASDRPGALPHRLPVGPDPGRRGPEDVEDEGQRRRSARGDGGVGRGCPPVRAHPRRDAGARPAVRAAEARERPELRQQALERDAVRRRGAAGDDRRGFSAPSARRCPSRRGGALDPLAGRRDDGRGRPGDGRLCLRRGHPGPVRRHLVRVLRLGPRARQGPARRRDAARPRCARRPGGRSSRLSTRTSACSIRSCRSSRSSSGARYRTAPRTRSC